MLTKVWSGYRVWDVPIFETGDITRDSSDDAVGAIFDKEPWPYCGLVYLPTIVNLRTGAELGKWASCQNG